MSSSASRCKLSVMASVGLSPNLRDSVAEHLGLSDPVVATNVVPVDRRSSRDRVLRWICCKPRSE